MILGSVTVNKNAVVTHRDSYLLTNLSVVSVRRPFLAGAVLLSGAFLGFGMAFADLLYNHEIATISVVSIAAILAGSQVGQLLLLSRDLRGSELSGAVWGRYSSLQTIRTDIVTALYVASEEERT